MSDLHGRGIIYDSYTAWTPSPGPAPEGDVHWIVHLRLKDGRTVCLDGRSATREDAVRSSVTEARAEAQQHGAGSTYGYINVDGRSATIENLLDDRTSPDDVVAEALSRLDEQEAIIAEGARQMAEIEKRRQAGLAQSPTAPSSLDAQWRRIRSWTTHHLGADAALARPGTTDQAINAAEQASGIDWPDELRQWFTLLDGEERGWGYPIPNMEVLDLDAATADRQMSLEIWDDLRESDPGAAGYYDLAAASNEPAGSAAGFFIPGFFPIAGLDGNFLVVDTRPGPLRGCITDIDKTGSDDGGPLWRSLSAMLDDLATSLETGAPFNGWLPRIVDGRLEWESPDYP